MGTAFIVQRPADPSLAAVPQLPASIYYYLPRAAEKLFGFSEITYRLPSVFALAVALFLISRLAARLIVPEASWFAVFACLALTDFNYYAADARPYALGICLACASVLFLIRWLDSARWTSALFFLLFGALLWRVQLVFWAFYPVFAIYTVVRIARSSTKVGWLQATLVYSALAIALWPVAIDALGILHNARSHAFAARPMIRNIPGAVNLPIVALFAAGGWLLGQFLKWKLKRPASRDALTLIGFWWLWTPLCLFMFSRVTGTTLFLPRYISLALPGTALAITAASALFVPRDCWKLAAIVVAVAALIFGGHWNSLAFNHTLEDWRQAAGDADLAAEEPDTPILAVSPYVEARPPVWSPEYKLPGFLYAPLYVYPVRGKVYPLPFVATSDTEEALAQFVRATLAKRSRFIVYGAGRNVRVWVAWLAKMPELADWGYAVDNSQVVAVVVFQKRL